MTPEETLQLQQELTILSIPQPNADDWTLAQNEYRMYQILNQLGLRTLDDFKSVARRRLAARRYLAETSGTQWNGHPVATDRQSQAMITGALLLSQMPNFPGVNWKMADGTFVQLSAADVQSMAAAVAAHVQGCFANEAALAAQVMQDPETDIDAGWPA
ncbi:MAG: DUF4376 domain-containing protein [Sinobacteraceae bacterium]|nr:DUF4376 domain-containing protein [Nevskiaceae bacterium]